MSSPDIEFDLGCTARVQADSPEARCRRECESLGLGRVRTLLADPAHAATPFWRQQAQGWVDERLAREGIWAFRVVVAGIVGLSAGIVLVALTAW